MADESVKRSPVFDWDKGDFVKGPQGEVVTVTGGDALQQVLIKALQTERGAALIYANTDDPDADNKYGNDAGRVLRAEGLSEEARLSELTRAVREAVIYDPWVTGAVDAAVTRLDKDSAEASMTVQTIFDAVRLEGVIVNG